MANVYVVAMKAGNRHSSMIIAADSKVDASVMAVDVWNDAESETPNIRVDMIQDTYSQRRQVLHVVNYKEE